MSRTPMTAGLVGGVLAMSILAGCSGEDLAERAIENRIESEVGDDVDIDFDDGDVSIKTEDGEIQFETDGDGNVSVSGSSDDGAFSMQSENGETVIETEDGSAVVSASGDLPDGFPSTVPVPDGLTILVAQSFTDDTGEMFVITGTVEGDAVDAARAYVERLTAAGFAPMQLTEAPDAVFFALDDGEHNVGGAASADPTSGGVSFSLSVGPTQQG